MAIRTEPLNLPARTTVHVAYSYGSVLEGHYLYYGSLSAHLRIGPRPTINHPYCITACLTFNRTPHNDVHSNSKSILPSEQMAQLPPRRRRTEDDGVSISDFTMQHRGVDLPR